MLRTIRPTAVLVAVLLSLLTVVGCQPGSPADPAPTTSAESAGTAVPEYPRQIAVGDRTVELAERPDAIIVLSPSLTESVYAVGAGEQVLAVDKLSTYPPEAKTSDLDAFQPNAEAIAGMRPDLVLMSDDFGGVVDQLTGLGIPTALLSAPATLDEAYAQLELIGQLTGNDDAGVQVAAETRDAVEAAVARVGEGTELSYYWELSPDFYSVTGDTFIGAVLSEFGLTSIADAAPDAAASGGYPQLSNEFILDADPDLIFAPGTAADDIRARPGWDVIRAVKDTDGIVSPDNDVSSRWGPRIAVLADEVATAVLAVR